MSNRSLIAYHANCIDGFTAAWVVYKWLMSKPMGDSGALAPVLLPMHYSAEHEATLVQRVKELEITNLYVVDFSLSLDCLEDLIYYPECKTVILDHHKTAFERYCPEVEVTPTAHWQGTVRKATVVLNNSTSGAMLCHTFLNVGDKVPKLVEYVSDYDLWTFRKGEDTKYINKVLVGLDKYIEAWDNIAELIETSEHTVLAQGKQLQKAHMEECRKVASYPYEISLRGQSGLAVECPRELTSDVGHLLAVKSGTYGCLISVNVKENRVTYSLRSEGDYDVSSIAKSYGGGGHKNAAGFMLPFFPEEVTDSAGNVDETEEDHY